jgi:hypothetical protein
MDAFACAVLRMIGADEAIFAATSTANSPKLPSSSSLLSSPASPPSPSHALPSATATPTSSRSTSSLPFAPPILTRSTSDEENHVRTQLQNSLNEFASQGLRTLVMAKVGVLALCIQTGTTIAACFPVFMSFLRTHVLVDGAPSGGVSQLARARDGRLGDGGTGARSTARQTRHRVRNHAMRCVLMFLAAFASDLTRAFVCCIGWNAILSCWVRVRSRIGFRMECPTPSLNSQKVRALGDAEAF